MGAAYGGDAGDQPWTIVLAKQGATLTEVRE